MTKHTVSAAANGLPEFTRRKVLIPIAGLISVGAIATAAAVIPTKSAFIVAAEAYEKSLWLRPDEGEDDFSARYTSAEHHMLSTDIETKQDAAALLDFIRREELSRDGETRAFEKLIRFLAA